MPAPPVQIFTFQPDKRTLGQILSSTSPPIRVPDYQRDYSWDKKHISEFWEDLLAFAGSTQTSLVGKEYFLGAAVLVNNGTFHLLLDGQQRLATATILLAALRDKISTYSIDAAQQIQNQYITFQDHLTSGRVFKVQMNTFDRAFFRDVIQSLPPINTSPTKKSHQLIKNAYDFFKQKIEADWEVVGGGKNAFDWAVHVANALREHMVLVTVVSNDEKSASSIFATLNDRGIGLSTVDLIRSFTLKYAHDSKREEIVECWDSVFSSCGTNLAAETLLRISWVAQHGDVKTRALYKVVAETSEIENDPLAYIKHLSIDAALYRQFRDGENEDGDIREALIAIRALKGGVCYPLLLAGNHKLSSEENKKLHLALVSLLIRYSVVCNLDSAQLESKIFATSKMLSDDESFDAAIANLRELSPSPDQFKTSFLQLKFTKSEHGIARYLLSCFDSKMATTREVTVAGAERVHLEHIYPQTPAVEECWAEHESYVRRLGNMTLLDSRLNETIKNAGFPIKKEQAYKESRLEVTKVLLQYDSWAPEQIVERQQKFYELAQTIWPAELI